MIACTSLIAFAFAIWPTGSKWERPFGVSDQSEHGADGPLEVAAALEMLALMVVGGAPTVLALEAVSKYESRDIRDELSRVAAALRWGADEAAAWGSAGPRWAPASRAFAMAGRAGAPPADLLRRAAADLRQAENDRVARAGAAVGVRIVLPLGFCFLPAFIALAIVPLVIGLAGPSLGGLG